MMQVNASSADLTGARRDDPDMTQANLQGATLRRATLLDVKMDAADLRDADVGDADFRGAADMRRSHAPVAVQVLAVAHPI